MMHLGVVLGKSLAEISALGSTEISYWQAYDRVDPLPDHWQIGAMIACTNYNLWSKERLNTKDFMPLAPETLQPKSVAVLKAKMAAFRDSQIV